MPPWVNFPSLIVFFCALLMYTQPFFRAPQGRAVSPSPQATADARKPRGGENAIFCGLSPAKMAFSQPRVSLTPSQQRRRTNRPPLRISRHAGGRARDLVCWVCCAMGIAVCQRVVSAWPHLRDVDAKFTCNLLMLSALMCIRLGNWIHLQNPQKRLPFYKICYKIK